MSSMRIRPVQATSPWWNPSRWDPWRDFEVLRRQVEQLCERPPQAVGSRDEYSPTVDICDAGGEFTVRVDLPGVRDEDVDVTLDGNVLSVRGSRGPDAGEAALLFGERRTGRFARTVALPAEIAVEQVRATLARGVLEVVLPKRAGEGRQKVTVTVVGDPRG